ncbi:FG-GAP repeat domain-containing protein [Streptomyces sp. NPDC051546]|uniref:FG-GAP repeat domain-containing protein n=1 Tax=Streptomyces sp. NPDC051546 TaxID=3365655 RepID=UPI0037B2FAF8
MAPGVGVPGREVTVADIDGDGDDDYYITVHPDTGAVTLWENQGASGAPDSGWAWQPRGRIASGVGARGENVRFADVDGDRRDDYVVLGASSGSVTAWSNGGYRPGSPIDSWNWNPLGQIAPGAGSPASHIRLATLYTYPNDPPGRLPRRQRRQLRARLAERRTQQQLTQWLGLEHPGHRCGRRARGHRRNPLGSRQPDPLRRHQRRRPRRLPRHRPRQRSRLGLDQHHPRPRHGRQHAPTVANGLRRGRQGWRPRRRGGSVVRPSGRGRR